MLPIESQNQILCLITARGGSKGLPGKNIRLLNGLPLLAYSINAALGSKYIKEVIVTTDDEEIASVARKYGARAPFLRPEELSRDTSTSEAAILHAIKWLEDNEKKKYDFFILLQPTSPLRHSKHIDEAIESYFSKDGVNTLYSVVPVKQTPSKMKKIDDSNYLKNYTNDALEIKRRQDFPKLYYPNGAIYISRIDVFKQLKGFDEVRLMPYIMKEEESFDIDTLLDFKIAEFLMNERKHEQ